MPTTTTGEAPVALESSTRTLTVGIPVTTGTAPVTAGSASTERLSITPGPWVADVTQAATVGINTVAGAARLTPPLATPPAHLTIPGIPFSTDPIAPLTVDSDGRVHSDGT